MQLSVNTFVSLDGVMQGPGGPDEDRSGGFEHGGWLVPRADEDMGEIVDGWFRRADVILLGRTTFEMMRAYWSQVTEPGNLVATALNSWRKYVVSTTLTDEQAVWGDTTVIRDDVLAKVKRLKEQPGNEIQVHGSWQLARTLHDAGIVDVYRLLYFPVVIGSGKRLFDGATPSSYELVDSRTTSAGATALTLQAREFRTGGFAVEGGQETVV
jgi:dihydrofolate reductase